MKIYYKQTCTNFRYQYSVTLIDAVERQRGKKYVQTQIRHKNIIKLENLDATNLKRLEIEQDKPWEKNYLNIVTFPAKTSPLKATSCAPWKSPHCIPFSSDYIQPPPSPRPVTKKSLEISLHKARGVAATCTLFKAHWSPVLAMPLHPSPKNIRKETLRKKS